MLDFTSLVTEYQTSATTVPELAARHNMKPADVGAILRLHGVKLRRGSPLNNLTPEARAKGRAVRQDKALKRAMKTLIDKHGLEAVEAAFNVEAGI